MFNVYAWIVGILLGAPFTVFSAFMALCTARSVQEAGVEFPPGMLTVARIWLLLGWPADVLFNATWGSWIFKEWRGLTFSAHIQLRIDNGLWDHKTVMWALFLNAGDPSGHHIRLPADFRPSDT